MQANKNLFVYSLLALSLIGLLSACGDGGKAPPSSGASGELSKYSQGKEYNYYRGGPCQTRDSSVCIDAKEAEFLCGKTSGYTPDMLARASTRGGDKARALFKGGNVSKLYADWSGDRCVASIGANGLYEGTSSKVRFVGEVATFVISGDGKVLAEWVDGFMEE